MYWVNQSKKPPLGLSSWSWDKQTAVKTVLCTLPDLRFPIALILLLACSSYVKCWHLNLCFRLFSRRKGWRKHSKFQLFESDIKISLYAIISNFFEAGSWITFSHQSWWVGSSHLPSEWTLVSAKMLLWWSLISLYSFLIMLFGINHILWCSQKVSGYQWCPW